eukprot:COSAG02_NODE_48961_length_330_cov_0.779221_1_plen_38_part_10
MSKKFDAVDIYKIHMYLSGYTVVYSTRARGMRATAQHL